MRPKIGSRNPETGPTEPKTGGDTSEEGVATCSANPRRRKGLGGMSVSVHPCARLVGQVADDQAAEVGVGQFPFRHHRQPVTSPVLGAFAFDVSFHAFDQRGVPSGIDVELSSGGGRNVGHFRFPPSSRNPLRFGC